MVERKLRILECDNCGEYKPCREYALYEGAFFLGNSFLCGSCLLEQRKVGNVQEVKDD